MTLSNSSHMGSSPLTRGKHAACFRSAGFSGLIPAHAGKTPCRGEQRHERGAHPRSRGENPKTRSNSLLDPGSSPLTRGKRRQLAGDDCRRRLIPAHAGKTHTVAPNSQPSRAHPRSRGENVFINDPGREREGSSPLTRGKRGEDRFALPGLRLIPAHAGKTPLRLIPSGAPRAHPRSRGENHFEYAAPETIKGSSPLTRGKRAAPRSRPASTGLIPAHAGKTPCMDSPR